MGIISLIDLEVFESSALISTQTLSFMGALVAPRCHSCPKKTTTAQCPRICWSHTSPSRLGKKTPSGLIPLYVAISRTGNPRAPFIRGLPNDRPTACTWCAETAPKRRGSSVATLCSFSFQSSLNLGAKIYPAAQLQNNKAPFPATPSPRAGPFHK